VHEEITNRRAYVVRTVSRSPRRSLTIAQPLRIAVHNHTIVGKNGHTSLKGMKLIQQGC
jgi:hypothetical protein